MKLKHLYIGTVILALAGSVFLLHILLKEKSTPIASTPIASNPIVSTSTVTTIVATTTTTTVTKTVTTSPKPVLIPKPLPKVIPPTPSSSGPILIQPSASSSKNVFIIKSLALLSGGTSSGGVSVPVAYLQVINSANTNTTLKGFQLKQNGSASSNAVVGFMVFDEKSNRVSIEGTPPTNVFDGNSAFVPLNVNFVPYEMKLFTIRAIITNDTSFYVGQDLKLDVVSVVVNSEVIANFPIRGTIWVLK